MLINGGKKIGRDLNRLLVDIIAFDPGGLIMPGFALTARFEEIRLRLTCRPNLWPPFRRLSVVRNF